MKYTEIKRDLFETPRDYYIAHCISADAKMGAGIAREIRKRFNVSWIDGHAKHGFLFVGKTYLDDGVFHLVTKPRYFDKPTYSTLTSALKSLKEGMIIHGIDIITMPTIGCGLDRLEWSRVRSIIQEVFADTDIHVVICFKD